MKFSEISKLLRNPLANFIITLITSGFVSGLILAYVSNNLEKSINSYQLKISRYTELGEELSRAASKDVNIKELNFLLNETLLFASEEVANAVLDLNAKLRSNQLAITESGDKIISRDELIPIFRAIREDLGLSSDFLDNREIYFFQL